MRVIPLYVVTLLAVAGAAHGQNGPTNPYKDGSPLSGNRHSAASLPQGDVNSFGANTPPSATSPAMPGRYPQSRAPGAMTGGMAAPGGGTGQVWVNASSKAYHCPGSQYYGKTKRGEYMTEGAAKASGAHPAGGRACS